MFCCLCLVARFFLSVAALGVLLLIWAVGYAGALVARRATGRVRAHFSILFPFMGAWGRGMLDALSLWPSAGRLVFPWIVDDGRLVPPWHNCVFDFVQVVSGLLLSI